MLPKKYRLTKKRDFQRVFKIGKGVKEKYLVLKVVPNEFSYPRFAFLVPLKVSKKAVVRNQIKRRLRYIVRKKLPSIKIGIDGIFIALPEIKEKKSSEIEEVVNLILNRLKIIKKNGQ